MTDKVNIDFANSGAVVLASAASGSAAVPANTELLAIAVTVPIHFRIGAGAQTAVVTDPLLTPGASPLIVKLDADISYTIAAIVDSGTTGTLSFYRVFEA